MPPGGRLIGLRYRYFGVGIVESLIISQDGRIVISSGDKMDVSVSARLLTENLAFSSLYIFMKINNRESRHITQHIISGARVFKFCKIINQVPFP